ncbi:MAG TPA: S1C family serine protease, partial [Candidatus Omnitrophota bacterium]|nr:S1C family serine protease [Candidatus Omnitrophota bacterium]
HVVPACKTIRVTFGDGIRRDATLVARDDLNDLAILDTPVDGAETVRFRDGKAVRAGEGVVVVGYPLSSVLSREANVTAGVVSALAGRKGDNRFLQITAPVQKGNSGGPLADMSGTIIGIVATKLDAMKIAERTGDLPQNVNFAIKAEVARQFLADHKIPYATATPGTDLSAADIGEMIKRVTVFVECEGTPTAP